MSKLRRKMFTIPIPSRLKPEDSSRFCYVNFGYSPDCKYNPKSCPRRAQSISCDCWHAIAPLSSSSSSASVNLNVSFKWISLLLTKWLNGTLRMGPFFTRIKKASNYEAGSERERIRARVSHCCSCSAMVVVALPYNRSTVDGQLRLLWEGLSLVKSRVNVTLIVTGFTQCFTAAVSITIRFLLLPQRRLFPPLFLW